MLFQQLIQQNHHPTQWRKGLKAILRKSNKSDYSKSKAYRIITLLKCLRKVSEKIIVNKLAYYVSLIDKSLQKSMSLKD